ncbi:MAG: hypothetical protein AAF433_01950 [Bacteroidota bacterium]
MSNSEDYYIGWREELPPGYAAFYRRCLLAIALLLPLLILAVVLLQKPFNQHEFRLGRVEEFTGVYHSIPVPFFIIDEGNLPADVAPQALLVGFGKFGATATMREIQASTGRLDGKRIKLAGTLIHGDGHAVLELTQGSESFISVVDEQRVPALTGSSIGSLQARGEILDPKCFFGVMKPGEGKIHKSCAIRCLSGGIPAVFRTRSSGESTSAGVNPAAIEHDYYILMDWEGNPLNEALLPYVGQDITINGQARQLGDWKLLFIGTDQLPTAVTMRSSLCGAAAGQLAS